MKTWKWKKGSLLLLTVLNMNLAIAGSDGTRGGETVNIDGYPRLRDLVDKATCRWYKGKEIFKEVSAENKVNDILNKLSYLDWYFAGDLKQDIYSLDYCLTGSLVRIDSSDDLQVSSVYTYGTQQVGIRINNSVYINEQLLKSLPQDDQGFFFVHESLHSYMSYSDPMRNFNLKSQVKATESVYQGSIASTQDYHLQMEKNNIHFPRTVDFLDSVKKGVEFVMLGDLERREILLNSSNVEEIFNLVSQINPQHLSYWHRAALPSASLATMIYGAILREDMKLLKKFVDSTSDIRSQTILGLLSHPQTGQSPVLKKFLLEQGNSLELGKLIYSNLLKRKAGLNEDYRIVFKGMEFLAQQDEIDLPFISLSAHGAKTFKNLRPETLFFINMITSFIKTSDWENLEAIVSKNDSFYEAFGKRQMQAELEYVQGAHELEKKASLRKIDTLLNGFWILTKEYVTKQASKKDWSKFISGLDQEKLGYQIK